MARPVWILDTGDYDTNIEGVFSTEANAKIAQRYLKKGSIREYAVDAFVQALKRDYRPYQVVMLRDGIVERCEEAPAYLGESAVIWERTKAPMYQGKGVPDALSATVWARNKKHAAKLANATRRAMIEHDLWPEIVDSGGVERGGAP